MVMEVLALIPTHDDDNSANFCSKCFRDYAIETLIITILGQANASDPDAMGGITKDWNKLDGATQRKLLPTILRRVVWHHVEHEITIDLFDDAGRKLNEERRPGEEQESG
jgi:hypothetical protein